MSENPATHTPRMTIDAQAAVAHVHGLLQQYSGPVCPPLMEVEFIWQGQRYRGTVSRVDEQKASEV